CLFSQRNGDPRDLHSFPTRRSSDLGARRIFQTVEIEHEFAGFIEAVGGKAGIEKPAGRVGGCGAGRVAKNEEKLCDRGILKNGLDRKSTRLNSSHEWISYAVFCLKE